MSSSEIAKLREETGAGVMDCKRALDDAKGNYEQAKKFLADNAATIAQKKAERATKFGIIDSYIHAGRIGVLVEVLCESDFVGKNEDFKKMVHQLALQIASMNPKNVEELLVQDYFADPSMKVSDYINSFIGKIQENIKVNRFSRIELGEAPTNESHE